MIYNVTIISGSWQKCRPELEVRRFRESESHGADSFTLFARSCPGVGVSFLPILLIGKLELESHGVGSFSLFGPSCPRVGVSFVSNYITSTLYTKTQCLFSSQQEVWSYLMCHPVHMYLTYPAIVSKACSTKYDQY